MSTTTPFTDPMRLFADLKLPVMRDMEDLLATYRRNIEVMSAANRVALEGAQAVAHRHMEIMQQTMAELADTVRTLSTVESPQAKAAKQADLLKRAYEQALANTKELSDLIKHANGEALALLNQRFIESMDEIKAMVEKSSSMPRPAV